MLVKTVTESPQKLKILHMIMAVVSKTDIGQMSDGSGHNDIENRL